MEAASGPLAALGMVVASDFVEGSSKAHPEGTQITMVARKSRNWGIMSMVSSLFFLFPNTNTKHVIKQCRK